MSRLLFSTTFISVHIVLTPQLSFHVSLLLSTPLNSCWLTSPQFHLSIFFSARSKWHSCKVSCLGQLNCLSIRSWFSTFVCVISLVSCAITIIQSYWTVDCYLWVRRSSHLNMPTWAWAEQLHAPRWIPDSQVTPMQVWSKHAAEQNSCTVPAEYLTAKSRLRRFGANMPLKHANMSVSRTAARFPLKYLTARSRLCRFGKTYH